MLADTSGDVEHPDLTLIVDDLEKVTVTGDDVDRHGCRAGQRPDHIVGLVAVLTDDGDAQSIQYSQDQRDLRRQPFRHALGCGVRRACHLGYNRVS